MLLLAADHGELIAAADDDQAIDGRVPRRRGAGVLDARDRRTPRRGRAALGAACAARTA